jgi:nitrite reductase/ring-hydroxylating ferredoxin subunit
VTRPWHGWRYEDDGQCRTNPAAKLRAYEVKVEAGEIFVEA